MTEYLRSFVATYLVEDDLSRPVGDDSYDFATEGVSTLSPAVEMTVSPVNGRSWHGRFFGCNTGPSVVVNGPSSDVIVVVASGVAYVVPIDSPTDYRVVALWPVQIVQCAPHLGLVVLADFTDVAALGKGGAVMWERRDLVSDGFDEIVLSESTVLVSGYVAREGRDVATMLALETGSILDRR